MDQKALFLKFWEKEAPATRKVLSRIPQEKSDYKPDPKSRNAREIAWLIVMEEKVLVDGLEKGALNWPDMPTPAAVKEILDAYDRWHDDLTARLHRLDHAAWEKQIPFLYQGQEVMKDTGYEFGWGILFDQIHHRGQLSTYLRPMGSTVPQIYGPSADEPM
ncbi:MAG: DinB family protein [candidate division KSB1 bacterium]|nr:DinB family protein [candidate division KSB1 bacterium]MDZ7366396.1 DinB family protein [candidate division KSB1 bacterium]MDZ7404051.1 DinB family protein [candidate division KSB1 bacterium]